MNRLSLLMCLALALPSPACDDGDDGPAPQPGGGGQGGHGGQGGQGGEDVEMGWLEIGTGFNRFEPLTAEQEVPIIAGIQGGFHIWGALRGQGFDASEVRILFELEQDGAVVGAADYVDFIPLGEDGVTYEYPAVAVVFDEPNPNLYDRNPTVMRVQLTDAQGQVLTDEIALDPVCCE